MDYDNPSTISDFDENDEGEVRYPPDNGGTIMDPNNMIHAGMLTSLLHQVCSAYEKNPNKRDRMFHLICQQLTKNQLLPSQSMIDMFSPMQIAYTKAFGVMMQTASQLVQDINTETHLRSLPSTDRERTAVLLQFQSLVRVPQITPEEIINSRRSRYSTDFKEMYTLGKGGFGKVYKVYSKLDGQHYAIKKIKLKHASIDKSYRLVNEVKVLAGLKHHNVVGYNTSWIEAEPMNTNTYQEMKPRGQKCLLPSSSESPRSSSEQESSTQDKNKVKMQDLGQEQHSLGMLPDTCNADMPFLQLHMLQTDTDLVDSPSRIARSPSDSTSTIVNSPVTPKILNLSPGEGDKSSNITLITQRSSVTQTSVSASSFSASSSTITVSTEEGWMVNNNPHAKKDLFCSSQECSSLRQTYHTESKITELHSNGQDSFSMATHSDLMVDEEFSDISIHFEESPNDFKKDFPDEMFIQAETAHNELSELDSGSDREHCAANLSNNILGRPASNLNNNKQLTTFPCGTLFGPLSVPLPLPSSAEIINLEESPDHKTKPQSRTQRRRHRSKSEDGLPTDRQSGIRTLSLAPIIPIPAFYVVLYIQMQLCSQTLADWLMQRNAKAAEAKNAFDVVNTVETMHIFKQIVHGIDYIHSHHVVHRDLKPKNIFLEKSGMDVQVRIGDFGLAKEGFLAETSDSPRSDTSNFHHRDWEACKPTPHHTARVGTTTYAAPEQLKGTKCDCKSDMYSSGIILGELFHPFKTQSERAKVIMKEVRQGRVPLEIHERWPKQYKAITRLTHSDSRCRPHAAELLKGPLFQSKDEVINELRVKLSEKEAKLSEKDAKLSEKDAENQRLKQRIAELERHIEKLPNGC